MILENRTSQAVLKAAQTSGRKIDAKNQCLVQKVIEADGHIITSKSNLLNNSLRSCVHYQEHLILGISTIPYIPVCLAESLLMVCHGVDDFMYTNKECYMSFKRNQVIYNAETEMNLMHERVKLIDQLVNSNALNNNDKLGLANFLEEVHVRTCELDHLSWSKMCNAEISGRLNGALSKPRARNIELKATRIFEKIEALKAQFSELQREAQREIRKDAQIALKDALDKDDECIISHESLSVLDKVAVIANKKSSSDSKLTYNFYCPEALAKWVRKNGTDPLTREPIELDSWETLPMPNPEDTHSE